MNIILSWLRNNGIEFRYVDKRTDQYVEIILEKDCIWVNGFGKDMEFDKKITIHKDTYRNFIATEQTGYNMFHPVVKSTKQKVIVEALAKRFEKEA